MLLQQKSAVIHGAGGAIGAAVARAFAREGAAVHLAGRSTAALADLADAAAFYASDRARSLTATVANLTAGATVD